jgi:hypothetical protein
MREESMPMEMTPPEGEMMPPEQEMMPPQGMPQ